MPDRSELFAAARAARADAYAPYSRFAVGAAVETPDGRRYTGVNVENASYGLTVCAERVAVFRAVADGARALAAIAVAGPDGTRAAPCGACRQVLAEFGAPTMPVIYANAGELVETTLGALLPAPFGER
jgi:homotetrameric cytidine deaminase